MDIVKFNSLPELKKRKIFGIDNNTQRIISKGFIFNNHKFSLSQNAQLNWSVLYGRFKGGDLEFPYNVTTNDDDVYTIQSAEDFTAFCNLAVYAVGYQIEVGRQLKQAVKACETVEQLKAIVDTRT